MSDVRPVRRALLAVYDKEGLVELARGLSELGVAIVSSGGTAATLRGAGVPVTPVEDVTGFPEMLDGRVKTLHPKIHAGILADRRKPEHEAQLVEQDIEPIDLVVVNLYPFRETVASGAGEDDVIEKIDIGGPAMVRAAAKNFASVGVVVSPSRYAEILEALEADGGLSLEVRRALAAEAFAHTAAYDAAVAGWFAAADDAIAGVRRPRVRQGRRSALRREPASARRAVRSDRRSGCPRRRGGTRRGQGDVVQQLARRGRGAHARGRPRPSGTGRGDRQAQQPVRCSRSGLARGGLCGGVRDRHGERVRWHRGVRARGGRGRGACDGRRLHRGRGRAVVHPGRPYRVRRAQGSAGGHRSVAGARWPRRARAGRGRARPGSGLGSGERGRPGGRVRRGNPPKRNGAIFVSRGSCRCG